MAWSSKAYRLTLRARGICPGCYFDHDGSRFLFCFECRVEQAEKSGRWYRRHRTYARARKRMSDAMKRSAMTGTPGAQDEGSKVDGD